MKLKYWICSSFVSQALGSSVNLKSVTLANSVSWTKLIPATKKCELRSPVILKMQAPAVAVSCFDYKPSSKDNSCIIPPLTETHMKLKFITTNSYIFAFFLKNRDRNKATRLCILLFSPLLILVINSSQVCVPNKLCTPQPIMEAASF